mmetsp:Transcript_115756/g.172998  ORF Transcript_115756/g.172998 Transcript_115756/m.172998 type:complete len:84 (-) Transcript_115756:401-652(-)
MNGTGSFNWRMVFPITLPTKDPTISFKIWDRDILSGDDFISEATLNFRGLAEDAFENDSKVKIFGSEEGVAIQNPDNADEMEK